MVEEFPKYIGFPYKDRLGSILRFKSCSEGVAIYERPKNTGNWICEVSRKDGKLIASCLGTLLNNREVIEATEEQFREDNYPWMVK